MAAHHAECRIANEHIGDSEPDTIRGVKELAAELKVEAAVPAEAIVLEYSQIQVVGAVPSHVG